MSGLYMWMICAGFCIAFASGGGAVVAAIELYPRPKMHPAKIVLIVLAMLAISASGAFMCGYGAQHYDELKNARKAVQE